MDRFNLTGLNTEVQNYSQALELITDNLGSLLDLSISSLCLMYNSSDDEIQDEYRNSLEVQARFLYGLIHARWVITSRGLTKMVSIVLILSGFTQR